MLFRSQAFAKIMSLADSDNIKKALTFLFLNIGIFIFAAVIFAKLDAMSHKVQAEVQTLSADLDWESFQYHQTVQGMLKK